MKTCRECGEEKPWTRSIGGPSGAPWPRCKPCVLQARRERYAKDRDVLLVRSRVHNPRTRVDTIDPPEFDGPSIHGW